MKRIFLTAFFALAAVTAQAQADGDKSAVYMKKAED